MPNTMSTSALAPKSFYVMYKGEFAMCRENEGEEEVGKRNMNMNIKRESLFLLNASHPLS